MKKLLALLLALATLLTLVACGGTTSESSKVEESKSSESSKTEESSEESEEPAEVGRFDALQEVDEQVSLLLYWKDLQPTINEEPTEEDPKVINACRYITAEWLEAHPNVSIEWCRNTEMTEEWITLNYAAGTGPDTFFYWGGASLVEQNLALVLDEIIESPNYYEPGAPIWKDMFPEYIWDGTESSKMNFNDKNEVIAIPSLINAGSATAYYVNKDLQRELGIEENPCSWKEVKENILTAREAGYTGTVVWGGADVISGGSAWDSQFSLAPVYFAPMIEDNDFNGDGIADYAEAFKNQWETGYFYLGNNPAMVEYWEEYFWKIHYGLEDGALDVSYYQAFTEGKVLYYEHGLWQISSFASNTELTFECGMFPPPVQLATDSEYVSVCEMTEAGPYKPTIGVATNIMNPEMQNRPEYTVDYVIDWMKYVMTNENLSMQIEENGSILGATKGCMVPASLTDWFTNSFPLLPSGYSVVLPGATDSTSAEQVALYQEYMYNMIDQETWIQEYDELLLKTMQTYFSSGSNEENKAAWAEQYGWDVSIWDAEPVKPPHMA